MPSSISQRLMRNALELAPFVYGFVGPDYIIQSHNSAALKWVGQSGCDLVGLNFRDLAAPEMLETVTHHFLQALSGEVITFERVIATKDGPRYSLAKYIPETDPAGHVAGVHIYIWDISEQRRVEGEARRLKDRFEGAFRSTAVGMAIVGPDGAFIEVNPTFSRMLGYTPTEILSLDFQTITHPQDLDIDLAHLGALIDGTSDAYTIEKRYITKAGAQVWGILSVSVVREPDGSVSHFVAQVQDITERKATEEKLFREHELAEVTLGSIGDGVITCDAAGQVNYLNPVAEVLTGWRTEQAQGHNIQTVFNVSDQDGQRVKCPMTQALETGATVELEANSNLKTRNGSYLPIEDSAAPIRDRAGTIIGGVLVFQDVSKRRALSLDLDFLAHHDALTGLVNRTLFSERLAIALERSKHDGSKCAVLFCDLDRFKQVNDVYGHASGDEILSAVAGKLRHCAQEGATVCRWAGDEFAILLPYISNMHEAGELAHRIVEATREPIFLQSTIGRVDTGMSVGISLYPDDGSDASSLMIAADIALYEAKRQGRSTFAFHSSDFNAAKHHRAFQERRLREALETGGVEVHYQPRISLQDGRMKSVEALVRLRCDGVLVYSGEFIPIAEEVGLIHELSRFVTREVCRQLDAWRDTEFAHLVVAINLSPSRLTQASLVQENKDFLEEFNLEPGQIEFEITESMLVGTDQRLKTRLDELHDFGFKLSLDDFGTGFSNLAYLRSLPVDTLKIDRSFISMPGVDTEIVKTINTLSRSFGKIVVAEGIETPEQEAQLITLGCDEAQGFLYARALSAQEFTARFSGCINADMRHTT